MGNNREMGWVIAPLWRLFLSVGLFVLLCAGLILSQSGCQKEASSTKSAAVQEPTVKAAEPQPAENVAKIRPVDKPAESLPPQQAKPPEPQPQGPATQAAGTPRIQVESPVQDFGNLGPDTTHTARFTFKSVGDAPLKILEVGACCGSVVRGVKDGQEYVPGESGTVQIDFHTGSYTTPISRKLTMRTNDPNQPYVTVTINANVVLRVDHEPKQVRLFLKKPNAGCGNLKLKSLDGRPFSIAGFTSTAGTLTAEFNPDEKATEFVLKPKVDMAKVRKNTAGQISIDLTHPECRNLRISYDVLPEFTVNPAQLILSSLKPGTPIQRDIWILNNYRDDFEVESVSSQQGLMKLIESKRVEDVGTGDKPAPPEERIGTRYRLRVEIMPPAAQEKRIILSDALQIKIKNGDTLTVHFRGWLAQGS